MAIVAYAPDVSELFRARRSESVLTGLTFQQLLSHKLLNRLLLFQHYQYPLWAQSCPTQHSATLHD